MSILNYPPENSNINIRVNDERFSNPVQSFLPFSSPGFTKINESFTRFSTQILMDLNTAENLSGQGYKFSDTFLLDGSVTAASTDERVELIRESLLNFEDRLNRSFGQTREEFVRDPRFFDFQNFISENRFSLEYAKKIINLRNNAVVRGNQLNTTANKKLLEYTFFGSTPSNIGEIQGSTENIYFYRFPQVDFSNLNFNAKLNNLINFYSFPNLENYTRDGNSVIIDPYRTVDETGNIYFNNTYNTRLFNVSIRMPVTLPALNKFTSPLAGGSDGFYITVINENASVDQSPFLSLSRSPVFVNSFSFPSVNPLTYKYFGISHKTILSKNRLIRTPSIGYGPGGNTDLQPRTPTWNSIQRKRFYKIETKNRIKEPVVNVPSNLFTITDSNCIART
jgi:hypothetical protein